MMVAVAAMGTAIMAVAPAAAIAAEPALAETLYQEGRALMAQGRTAEACAKFDESLRLDQATGTLLNLAVCHEALGKLATAWAEFRAGASIALHDGRQDRTQLAREHLARIEPRLSRLTVSVPDRARVAGLRITLDGMVLGAPAWNVATPIDPGTHVVEARAPGHRSWSQTVVVGASAMRLVAPVTLEPLPQAVAAAPAPAHDSIAPPGPGLPGAALSAAANEGEPNPVKVAAYVTAGVGVAAVVVGSVFGIRALSRWSDRNGECPMDACNDAGLAYSQQAESSALTSDVAFGLGAVSLAAAGYLFYRAYAHRVPTAEALKTAAARGRSSAGAATISQRPGQASWELRVSAPRGAALGLAMGWDW